MRSLIFLTLVSIQALACPKTAPAGFEATKDSKELAFTSKDKMVQLVVRCDERVQPKQAAEALSMLGQVKTEQNVSYVDLQAGAMRMYVGGRDATQVAAVAKTPEALEKATPAIIEYLKKIS